jgi:hypothetical protein
MPERKLIEFVGDAATEVPDEMKPFLEKELETVITAVFAPGRVLEAITVSRFFSGHSRDLEKKIVLGVEVRYNDGPESHIVKLGLRDKVKVDSDGWDQCTAGRPVSSRIFAPVRGVALEGERYAVLYRDAYTLFGLNRQKNQPLPLQDVARWAMLDDRPSPDSVERVIAQIYTDLGVWFYPGAKKDAQGAFRFYRHQLGMDVDGPDSERHYRRIIHRWKAEELRQQLRRDTVWALCGRDKPTADPKTEPARYLDPLEYVEWVLADEGKDRLPNTLVGRTHGDLHALNVLVGVRRGEAEFPVIFDYGEMKRTNVLVWDFVKLETELKVRLLPVLLYDAPEREQLLTDSRLRPKVDRPAPPCPPARVDRLRAFLAFEERLHDLTSRIESREDAEPIRLLCPPPTGLVKLDRLLAMLLRVRKEAAIWLGFDQPLRQHLWRDEYGLALAVAGLLNVKWDYDPPQQECALVSAGAAVAHMPSTPARLRAEIQHEAKAESGACSSYRVSLAVVHQLWSEMKYEQARQYIEQVVLEPGRHEGGRLAPFVVRPEAWHAIPLIAEAALIAIEQQHLPQAELLLRDLRQKALELGDFETLGRIGRLFKDSGDRHWENSNLSFDELLNAPGWQFYNEAKKVYAEAFEATNDYYTGINAATLALLTHDIATAKRLAQRVADLCSKPRALSIDDRPWLFATEGEAAIILNNSKALTYYAQALNELIPGDGGKANSMYKQLCRLWKALGDRVSPVLELFEKSAFKDMLSPHYLGRNAVGAGANSQPTVPTT